MTKLRSVPEPVRICMGPLVAPAGEYLQALGARHGWSDGDGYYETYLGHPIQGAVASYMWIHNDPKYRVVEFGKSRDCWHSSFARFHLAAAL